MSEQEEIKKLFAECNEEIANGDLMEAYATFGILGSKIISSPNKKELVKIFCEDIIKLEKFFRKQ
jgi:hypothetical protein